MSNFESTKKHPSTRRVFLENLTDASMPPGNKYGPYQFAVELLDRTWPNRQITQAPRWCSVDLRDGNQALPTPMDLRKKIALYKALVRMGFREIEIGFPSASQVEFEFTRWLVENRMIPKEVMPQVLVQAREHLIRKTFDALRGADEAIIHIYNSTSELQRRVVFDKSQAQVIDLAVQGVRLIRRLAAETDTRIRLEYSP